MTTDTTFYVTGGTLRRDAPCYVVRQADGELYDGLTRGRFCYVLTSRQMGKSSLMVRAAARLREDGAGVAVLDLTAIGQNLTADQWYDGLLRQMGQQLGLEDELEQFWLQDARLGPFHHWMDAIRHIVLPRYPGRVVLFVDEIDTVRTLPFPADEFFAGIRECYNHRTVDPDLERLTFCLLGVATPSDLIRDPRTTPFNIGQRIELSDFREAEAAPLASGLGREPAVSAALLERVLHWTGGHPYLTQRLCQAVAERSTVTDSEGVDQVCRELFLSHRARERDDNLLFVRERLLRTGANIANVLRRYAKVRRGARVRDEEANPEVDTLRLSGIVRAANGCLCIRNRIYERVFDQDWIKSGLRETPPASRRAIRSGRRLRRYAASAVLTALLAAAAILSSGRLPDRSARLAAQRATTSIAVLPFKDLRAAGQDEDLGLGMAEALIAKLGGVRQLTVRPASAVRNYLDVDADLLKAGRDLKVDEALGGTVEHAGDRVRLVPKLMRMSDGKVLWADRFEESFNDVFALEDAVAQHVTQILAGALTPEEERRLTARYTNNTEAYTAYIRGRHQWNKRTIEGFLKGAEEFKIALDLDPTYALAYAGLADCYNLHGEPVFYQRAKAAARQALALDDSLASAHTSLAFALWRADWDFQGAEKEFRRSLELDPNYATTHQWYGIYLSSRGRFDDGIKELKPAEELDPLSTAIGNDLGGTGFFFARRFDEAIAQERKMLELDSRNSETYWNLAEAFLAKGMVADATRSMETAVRLKGRHPDAVNELALIHLAAGRRSEAMQLFAEAAKKESGGYQRALFYHQLGDESKVFALFEQALEQRQWWALFFNVDPRFDSLHRDPRFEPLVRRIEQTSRATEATNRS